MGKATTLPILTSAHATIQGSGAIIDFIGMTGGAPALESRFEEQIGVLVRQFLYAGTLGVAGSGALDVLLAGVPAGQALLGRLMWPVTRRLMVSSMEARVGLLPELRQKLSNELDWFEAELSGRQYLVGERFGRADLTAASLLGPLARPRECPIYGRVRLPEYLEQSLGHWRTRPSLRWVKYMYATHRQRSQVIDLSRPPK